MRMWALVSLGVTHTPTPLKNPPMNLVARAIANEVDTPKASVESALVRMPIISTGCTQNMPYQECRKLCCTFLQLKACCTHQAHQQQEQFA